MAARYTAFSGFAVALFHQVRVTWPDDFFPDELGVELLLLVLQAARPSAAATATPAAAYFLVLRILVIS
jgi:hypothetical protein